MIARSNGLCEMCGMSVVEDGKMMGQVAHIRGKRPGSGRHDADMSQSEMDSLENLILLCANCHVRVDKQPLKYTTEKMLEGIRRSELKRAVGKAMPEIEFPELDEAVQHIASAHTSSEYSYTLVPPEEKIRKNHLTSRWVIMGLSQAPLVGRYMDKHSDAESGQRLRAGFVKRYKELVDEGLEGDKLFEDLWRFASGQKTDPKMQAAALALLVYLFEKCEVFES